MDGYLSDHDLEMVVKRLEKSYKAKEIIEKVFTKEKSKKRFINALCELANKGYEIKVGGRALREIVGCQTVDFAKDIRWDARYLESVDPHAVLRLGPLLDYLKKYDAKRMIKPDLDFFIWGATPEEIMEVFANKGFNVSIQRNASGGVWVVDIVSENGMATFVDGDISWQTEESQEIEPKIRRKFWPKYGFMAKFESEPQPQFNLDISYGRFVYPLAIPYRRDVDPLSPPVFAAVARSLLWLVTAKDIYGKFLRLPPDDTLNLMKTVVSGLPALIRDIKLKKKDEGNYRSGLRDIAIALRLIVLNDFGEFTDWSYEKVRFLRELKGIWESSLWHLEP